MLSGFGEHSQDIEVGGWSPSQVIKGSCVVIDNQVFLTAGQTKITLVTSQYILGRRKSNCIFIKIIIVIYILYLFYRALPWAAKNVDRNQKKKSRTPLGDSGKKSFDNDQGIDWLKTLTWLRKRRKKKMWVGRYI